MITSAWVAIAFFCFVCFIPLAGQLLNLRQELRQDCVRAVIIDSAKRARTYFRKIQTDTDLGEYVQVSKGQGKYLIVPECIVRRGMFRFPYLYYVQGVYKPVDLMGGNHDGDAFEIDAVGEHHVMSDLLGSFKQEILNPTTILIILVLVIALTGFGVYSGVSSVDKKILANQIREDPSLVATTVPTPFPTRIGQ